VKVLLLAECVTLAHLARPLALVDRWQTERAAGVAHADVQWVLARDPRSARFCTGFPGEQVDLASLDPARFVERLARGQAVYRGDELDAQVQADLALYADLRPDLVIGDFRLSMAVSARRAGLPCATLCNAYWVPGTPVRPVLPVLPWTSWVPLSLAQRLFDRVQPWAFAAHARTFRDWRARQGLHPGGLDLRAAYTDADRRWVTDAAALFPDLGQDRAVRRIGPLTWSAGGVPDGELAQRLQAVDPAPLVYVSMGSSGRADVLPLIARALLAQGCRVVMSSAGLDPARLGVDTTRLHVAPYVPAQAVIDRASLVVCNGGSLSVYQALDAGVPLIGIASNLDQFLSMAPVVARGAGTLLRADRLTLPALTQAVRHGLEAPSGPGGSGGPGQPGWPQAARTLARSLAAERLQRPAVQALLDDLGR
jgi:UDP:flavonoid glycosyltransferase YjiC (YdhE family)